MNIWHDLPKERVTPESFTVCIEISKGGKAKYELDKETGALRLDRILFTSTHYPHNYGFIPGTYSQDADPLDALVICSEPIVPMALVQCYALGVVNMVDGGHNDEKIIAVPHADPVYNGIHSIRELPAHVLDEIRHFFSVYKELEGSKTAVASPEGPERAREIIGSAIRRYRQFFEKQGEEG